MCTWATCGVMRSPGSVNLVRTPPYYGKVHYDISAVVLFPDLMCSIHLSFQTHIAQSARSGKKF